MRTLSEGFSAQGLPEDGYHNADRGLRIAEFQRQVGCASNPNDQIRNPQSEIRNMNSPLLGVLSGLANASEPIPGWVTGGQPTEQQLRDFKAAGADALLVFPIPAYLSSPLNPAVPVAYHTAIAEVGLPLILFQLQPALAGVKPSGDIRGAPRACVERTPWRGFATARVRPRDGVDIRAALGG